MTQRRSLIGLILFILFCSMLALFVPSAQAQAPAPDAYEENDSLAAASFIPMGSQLGSLSISPAADPDWFRFLVSPPAAYPDAYRVEVVTMPGLDLTLNLVDPGTTLIQSNNDPSGPNAAVTFNTSSESYYTVEVSSSTTA